MIEPAKPSLWCMFLVWLYKGTVSVHMAETPHEQELRQELEFHKELVAELTEKLDLADSKALVLTEHRDLLLDVVQRERARVAAETELMGSWVGVAKRTAQR